MSGTSFPLNFLIKAPGARWLRQGGLFRKFVLSFVGLVVFVLIVNGAVEAWFLYRETKAAVVGVESERARAAALRIDQALSDIERRISWVTRASATGLDQRRLDYGQLLEQVPAIEEVVQLDASGHEQLRSRRNSFVAGTGADYSRDPRFTEARGGSVWWSPVYFRGHDPFALIAMAHLSRNAGVTVAEVKLKFLAELVDANQAGGGKAAYVIDQNGRLLAHSDKVQSPGADLSRLPQTAALIDAKTGPISVGRDIDGLPVLTAAAPVPKLKGFVIYEEPLRQVFTRLYDFLNRAGLLLALGLLVATGAGSLLARRMVVPIQRLQAGARELGATTFSHRIDVNTGDEVEELADHFNRMAGQLQESYARLEQKVEDRTRDLAMRVGELKALEETGRAINSSLDLEAVLATVLAKAVKFTEADAGAIYCYNDSTDTFELAQACGVEPQLAGAARFLRLGADERLLSSAIRQRAPVLIRDLPDMWGNGVKNPLTTGAKAILVVPLAGQKEILGLLLVQSKASGALKENMTGLMQTFAHQSVLAIQNARLFQEVTQKSEELAKAHATVKSQAEKLKEQTGQLESWNHLLEERVAAQLTEIERMSRLQRFLAPQLAQVIAFSGEDPSLLASHRREVTVVFCDLRGFTAFTESTEPEEVMKVLREYHAVVGEIVFQYEGTLDRFAGDGILILFNDPIPYVDHTERAVRMAVEMRDSVGKLCDNWRSRGHRLGFGIGIALGYATLGQVGFERRLEYAAVGSVTNLASRLCDEAKAAQIVISQRAYGIVERSVDAAPIGELNLKGFNRPMPAFEVLAWRGGSMMAKPDPCPPAATM
jgi:class 3 adenylate cyclase/HAMP domain-containing protein